MSRYFALIVLGLLSSVAYAQQEVPFEGIVRTEGIQARAGAKMRFYIVGNVPKGQRVRVDEVLSGWYKITCPPGIYSYISKAFVDARGDGKTGVVNGDQQRVKAASILGPAESYRTQMVLNKDDVVTIVSEEDSHYKIVPPKGTYVFLPPGSVQIAAPVDLNLDPQTDTEVQVQAQPDPDPGPDPEPAVPDEALMTIELPPGTKLQTLPLPLADAQAMLEGAKEDTIDLQITSTDLVALDLQMLPLFASPVEDQPIDQMLAAYEGLDRDAMTEDDLLIVAMRIAVLKYNQRLAQTLKQINQVQQEIEAGQVETGDEDHENSVKTVKYDVIGSLRASAVYSGETLPRLYRVLAGDGRTIGWVSPKEPIDARIHLGELVGIVGQSQYDDALKLNIFTVEKIDLLEASE